MFYLDIAKLDLVLHMLQCLYTYVAIVCFGCFQTYVASGLSGCCICCTGYTRTLQVYVQMFSYFKYMLQVFYLNIAYVAVDIHVCCICFKCFSYFKCMLQTFYLNVAYVIVAIPIYCKSMF
jgi:hypothetical protein